MDTRNWTRMGLFVVGTILMTNGESFAQPWAGSSTTTGTVWRTGDVGIGTSAPWAKLHLVGTGFPSTFMFLQSDTGQDSGFRLYEGNVVKYHLYNDASENVLRIDGGNVAIGSGLGIGTTAPTQRLHIKETALNANVNFRMEDSNGDGIHLGFNSGGNHGALSSNSGGNSFWDTITWKDGRVGINGTPWQSGSVKPTLTVHGDIRVESVPVWNGPGEHDLTWENGFDNGIAFDPPRLRISREGSSLRYKKNVKALEEPFSQILTISPKRYQMQDGYGPKDAWSFGYIAEELHEAGLHNLVIYDAKGRPDGVQYKKIAMYVNEVVKDQQRTIEQLQSELDDLKKAVNQLKR